MLVSQILGISIAAEAICWILGYTLLAMRAAIDWIDADIRSCGGRAIRLPYDNWKDALPLPMIVG